METEFLRLCDLCSSTDLIEIDRIARIWRCEECGYVFDNPRPTLQELVRFYSQPGKYDSWLQDEELRFGLWKRRLRMMRRDFRPGSLLDVGAGIGQFVALAQRHYSPVTGTEVSSAAVQIAAERYGIALRQGDLLTMELQAGCYDNITMFHVLEHVPSPHRLLDRAWQLLTPGGHLFVAVPNDVPTTYRKGQPLPTHAALGLDRLRLDGTMSEIHLSHFRPEVLRKALVDRGFSVVRQIPDPYFVASGASRLKAELRLAFHRAVSRVQDELTYVAMWTVAVKV